ncbi:MAG: nucleotide pyrophosphohydrolase, partial [bacterium]
MKRQTTIKELHDLVADFQNKRDWRKFQHPKDVAMSIAIEASELMELFQWKNQATLGNAEEMEKDFKKIKQDKEYMQRIKEELADVLIYCLSLSAVLDIDLGAIVLMKLKMSAKKYP